MEIVELFKVFQFVAQENKFFNKQSLTMWRQLFECVRKNGVESE